MKNGYLVLLATILFLTGTAYGMGERPVPKIDPSTTFLIDDFESGSIKQPRQWWTFSLERIEVASNRELKKGEPGLPEQEGDFSLLIYGTAKNRFAGGCGTYLAEGGKDLTKYNNFQLDIYGHGVDSGSLSIELIDDDNNNWQREEDPKDYTPLFDDKFVHQVVVNWEGWKRISIPFADFKDVNPGIGDDVWNPAQTGGSGGLLQMEITAYAKEAAGVVNLSLDNVCLTGGRKL